MFLHDMIVKLLHANTFTIHMYMCKYRWLSVHYMYKMVSAHCLHACYSLIVFQGRQRSHTHQGGGGGDGAGLHSKNENNLLTEMVEVSLTKHDQLIIHCKCTYMYTSSHFISDLLEIHRYNGQIYLHVPILIIILYINISSIRYAQI